MGQLDNIITTILLKDDDYNNDEEKEEEIEITEASKNCFNIQQKKQQSNNKKNNINIIIKPINVLFIDHDKTRYKKDIISFEKLGLLKKDSIVIADNVKFACIDD